MYYIHKNGNLTLLDAVECVTSALPLCGRVVRLTTGFKRVEEAALRILWFEGLRHFRSLVQLRFLNIPETGILPAFQLAEKALEYCEGIQDVEIFIDNREEPPTVGGYGRRRRAGGRGANDEERTSVLSFFSPPPRGPVPPPPPVCVREKVRRGDIVRGQENNARITLLIHSEGSLEAHHLDFLSDHESPQFQRVQSLQVSSKRSTAETARAFTRALPCFPLLSTLYLYIEDIEIESLLSVIEEGLLQRPNLRELGIFRRVNPTTEEAAQIVNAMKELLLPALDLFHGIKLSAHKEILRLPDELRGAENDAVLAYLRQLPTDGCRQLYLTEGTASREMTMAAVARYGRALRYAPEALKSDREVVLGAVESSGNGALPWETDTLVWEQLESYVDPELVVSMRAWCSEKHGEEEAKSMSFQEVHAQFVSYPDGSEEDRQKFPNLGWVFLQSLEPEHQSQSGEAANLDDVTDGSADQDQKEAR